MSLLRIIILFTIINLAINSCATPKVYSASKLRVDKELKPYLDRFLKEAEKRDFQLQYDQLNMHIIDGVEQIKDPDEGDEVTVLALCHQGDLLSDSAVEIDESFWRKASMASREAVVFHELGHCLLGEDHRSQEFYMGSVRVPVSLMHKYTPKPEVYTAFREYYLDELFDNTNLAIVISSYKQTPNTMPCYPLTHCPRFPTE